MKIKILKYLAAASILLSVSSCDDFLTEVNPNEISTESYWKNLTDCNKGLTAVYNQFRSPGLMGVAEETKRTDLSFPGWGRPNTSDPYYLQMFTASSGGANSKWENLYKGIFRANQVIDGLENLPASEVASDEQKEQWAVLMGEAKFFRGLFYFYLHSSYNNGSVILYDFVPESEADFNQPLTDESVIKDFYRNDLMYALENLPEQWTDYDVFGTPDNDNNLGRVTTGAAAAVLGKSYLYEKDYTTAASYFKEVIDSGNYRLVDVADNFTTRGEFNQESILEIAYNANTKVEEDPWSAEGTSNTYNLLFSPVGGWRAVYPANWLIMEYMEDPLDPTDSRNMVTEDDGSQHLRKYSLRTSHSIAIVDDVDMPYYKGSITADGTIFNNAENGYWRKMTNWDILESEKTTNQKSGVNFRVIRFADVLLMYAECLIAGGTDDAGLNEALFYVNAVRYRSALRLLGPSAGSAFSLSTHDEVTYTAQSLMDHLMYKERPLELSAEGYAIRQLDMRRWGITKARFEDLSTRYYKLADFTFYSEIQDKELTRWGGLLEHATADDFNYKSMDLVQAANNYNEATHAYWPIPTSETTANSEVN